MEALVVITETKNSSALTPAVSPGERGKHSDELRWVRGRGFAGCGRRVLPLLKERAGVRVKLMF